MDPKSEAVSRPALFCLFGLSGFSGLIYESIWTHYIKLFLGHAAYAQTLVLAIFMGGLAAGAWLASGRSGRWRNPLLVYAWVEGLIGLAALLFHRIFLASTDWSYDYVIPALASPAAVQAWKWSLSALLILPQSVLLGMTFPLMSSGIIRRWPQTPGRSLGMLYFSNSIGAVFGVLVSGFYLIGLVGLPGTMLTAGLINICLALVVWVTIRGLGEAAPIVASRSTTGGQLSGPWLRWLLIAAAVTGGASLIYELAWIRLLSLVLGSSTHSFELMLSAFILGLALGGLWIRRRIERLANPIRSLANIQIAMGLLALATVPLYGKSFDLAQLILEALSRTEPGYQAFHFASHFICLIVMLPATICAGMTLPLLTYALLQRGGGEKVIGAVYGANTLGSIAGVLLAINLLMPLFGAKGLLAAGSAIDIALGLALLWAATRTSRPVYFAATAVAAVLVFGLALVAGDLNPLKLASGVFRTGQASLPQGTQMLLHLDGKTATVSLFRSPEGYITISTNGKPDAQINMGPTAASAPSADEMTMVLLGTLGLAHNPQAHTAASIGMGSGLTAHVMLSTPQLDRLDTIEIEAEMVRAAHGFGERVHNTFSDPRSHVFLEDAKAFLSTRHASYDIIVSEPSNPWVSGVASLFSVEFYGRVREHLSPDGVFVQWLQLYETDMELVASIMKALSPYFSDYVVYNVDEANLVIVARKEGRVQPLSPEVIQQPGMAKELQRIGVVGLRDFGARRIGDKRTLDPMFQSFGAPLNSDYFPFVDQRAARARFLRSDGSQLNSLWVNSLPMLEMLGRERAPSGALTPNTWLMRSRQGYEARSLQRALVERRYGDYQDIGGARFLLPHLLVDACDNAVSKDLWIGSLLELEAFVVPLLGPDELEPIWARMEQAKCYSRLTGEQKQWLTLVRAIGRRDPQAMAINSQQLLEAGIAANDSQRLSLAVGAGMLGNILTGQPALARALWVQYGSKVPKDDSRLDFRLMLSLCDPGAFSRWTSAAPLAQGPH
jgi:spermidine synthase